jgi:hypothetical protein
MKRFLYLVSLIFSVCVFSQKVCAESPPDNPAAVIAVAPDYSPVTAYTPEAPSWPLRFAQEFKRADSEFNRVFLLLPVLTGYRTVIPVLAYGNYYPECDSGIFKRLCFQSPAYNYRYKRGYYERFLKLPVAPLIFTYNI